MKVLGAIAIALALCFAAGWAISVGLRAPAQRAGEPACVLVLAGSNALGERLAPALVAEFLAGEGYRFAVPEHVRADELRFIAVRGERECVVEIRSHGSAFGFQELLRNRAEIGISSRRIGIGEVAALRAVGAGDFAADPQAEHVIALDSLAVIVNADNPLDAISLDDLRRVFLGEISDWSTLGGAPGPIQLYVRDERSGTTQYFVERVLGDDARAEGALARARSVDTSAALVQLVSEDAAAIGLIGLADVRPEVRTLAVADGGPALAPSPANVRSETYPLTRRLYLYVRPQTLLEPGPAARFVAFVKSEAAYAGIEREGYVSLRPDERLVAGAPPPPPQAFCVGGAVESETYRRLTEGAERLASVIRFEPEADNVDALARDDIARAAEAIQAAQRQGRIVSLIGHSDSIGDSGHARLLALQRAATIREAFEAEGVAGLELGSAGAICPIADNGTREGRHSNRRVEIWIGPAPRG